MRTTVAAPAECGIKADIGEQKGGQGGWVYVKAALESKVREILEGKGIIVCSGTAMTEGVRIGLWTNRSMQVARAFGKHGSLDVLRTRLLEHALMHAEVQK